MLIARREGAKQLLFDRGVPEAVVARNVAAALAPAPSNTPQVAADLLVRESCALLCRLLADDDLSIMVRTDRSRALRSSPPARVKHNPSHLLFRRHPSHMRMRGLWRLQAFPHCFWMLSSCCMQKTRK